MTLLCLESGGTKLVGAVADGDGHLIDRLVEYRRTDQRAPETIRQLISLGKRLYGREVPDAVSFGFGGIVDRLRHRPKHCYHEDGWEDLDAMEQLESAFRTQVFVENDCNLAALAEAWRGFGHVHGTLLYVTVGTGIGAGVVRDGELLRLGPEGEMELGHCIVAPDGPLCPCGNRGCLETLCSGPGLSLLAERMGEGRLDARQIMAGLDKPRDRPESRIADQAARYMGEVLAEAVNLVAPDLVVLGGGVMEGNRAYLKAVQQETLKRVFPPFRQWVGFELSRLRRDVVCQGAAVWALQRLGKLERPIEMG